MPAQLSKTSDSFDFIILLIPNDQQQLGTHLFIGFCITPKPNPELFVRSCIIYNCQHRKHTIWKYEIMKKARNRTSSRRVWYSWSLCPLPPAPTLGKSAVCWCLCVACWSALPGLLVFGRFDLCRLCYNVWRHVGSWMFVFMWHNCYFGYEFCYLLWSEPIIW